MIMFSSVTVCVMELFYHLYHVLFTLAFHILFKRVFNVFFTIWSVIHLLASEDSVSSSSVGSTLSVMSVFMLWVINLESLRWMALWRTDPFYEITLSKLTSFPSFIRGLYIGGFYKNLALPCKRSIWGWIKKM